MELDGEAVPQPQQPGPPQLRAAAGGGELAGDAERLRAAGPASVNGSNTPAWSSRVPAGVPPGMVWQTAGEVAPPHTHPSETFLR